MSTLAEALAPRSDQLNADDLIPGPRTLKITDARISKEDRQTRIIINFEGDNGKPWKPCKTMGRAMVMAWSITDEKQMIGKAVRVYRDPEVKFGDQGAVGGIRISHMSDIDKPATMKLTVSQGKKSLFTFHPLVAEVAKKADPAAIKKWADDHLGFVTGAQTLDRLAEVQAMGAKAMAKLATSDPDTHARVTSAYAARLDDLSAADDDPFAANPATPEGRDDADMGEGA